MSFNPNPANSIDSGLRTKTDEAGEYEFPKIPVGVYNIEASDTARHIGVLIQNISVADTAKVMSIRASIMLRTGKLFISFPNLQLHTGDYLSLPGTIVFAAVDSQAVKSATVNLADVPAGKYPMLSYVRNSDSLSINVLNDSLTMLPGALDSITITKGLPKYSRNVYLNTTASGANVMANVPQFPVVIRLNGNNFNFAEASSDGSDIRFTKTNGVPLPYEIERWNPVADMAEVWVKVDTVFGDDSTHFVNMLWGASAISVASSASGAAVFDTADGFQAVWHFAEAGNAAAKDATINGYDGTPSNMTAASSVAGAIGNARNFDGSSSSIQMIGTATGKLNFNENDYYTISAWVNTDTLYSDTNAPRHDLTIVAKDNCQYMLKCFRGDFAFVQYKDAAGWATSMSPAVVATWKYVVGVCAGTRQYLYVDGVLSADSANFLETSTRARYSASDVFIGKTPSGSNNWSPYFFKGKIDEVRIANKALSADWIKLCYMNQKTDDKLVIFK